VRQETAARTAGPRPWHNAPVSSPRGLRLGRPYRRLRRWARRTPNGMMALNMMAAGVVLIFIAILLAVVLL